MFKFGTAGAWDQKVALAWFIYRLDSETREALMAEMPGVYNRLMDQQIVKTVRISETA